MKTFVVKSDYFHPFELSVETVKETVPNNSDEIPVYGSFATVVAHKLRSMFAKEQKGLKEIPTLGRDMTGKSNEFNYQLGRRDVVTGITDTQTTMRDGELAVEHVQQSGIGLYNIMEDVAGLCKGVENTMIVTFRTDELWDEQIDFIKDLIIRANKHIILILFVDEQTELTNIEIKCPKLYELLGNTGRLDVYLTYLVKRPS